MESEYLVFDKYIGQGRKLPGHDRKLPIYEVKNKATLDSLGVIYFYSGRRKYVFESTPQIVYDAEYLTDIAKFLQEVQNEWEEELKNDE